MKWKLKNKLPEPKVGDTRTCKWFCILPIRTDDGYIVWLEWVDVIETYKEATIQYVEEPIIYTWEASSIKTKR